MVIDPKSVNPLTDFNRNTKAFLTRLRKSGQPEMLTINGKAAVVIQDAAAYSEMLHRLEQAYFNEAVQVGIEQMEAGKVTPIEEVVRKLRARRQARVSRPRRKSA